jgi:hypothetical protein
MSFTRVHQSGFFLSVAHVDLVVVAGLLIVKIAIVNVGNGPMLTVFN